MVAGKEIRLIKDACITQHILFEKSSIIHGAFYLMIMQIMITAQK
jgi:hypothetical protein